MTTQRSILTCAAALVALAATATTASGAHPPAATAPADGAPVVRLYDTGKPTSRELTAEELVQRTGWKEVAEGDLQHRFTGDAVFMNDQLAVALCSGSVRVHSRSTGKLRAGIAPSLPYARHIAIPSGVRTVQNSSSAVAMEANYGDGAIRLRLAAGAFFLEAGFEKGGTLWVMQDGNYVVVPDFFGDDYLYDLSSAKHQFVPADNSLLALADAGKAIVACVWAPPSRKNRVSVSMDHDYPKGYCRFDLPMGRGIWLAVFEGKDIWRECAIDANNAGWVAALDWRPPFPAKWRASLAASDAGARSWNLHDSNTEVTPPAGRQKLVIYPIDRTAATPLTTYCLTDLMRDALGVGPCQYVLDAEGLGAAETATPEQVARWLERELAKKPARRDGEAIAQRLAAMTAHVRRTQERIEKYRRAAAVTREACKDWPDADPSGPGRAAMAILDGMLWQAAAAPASGPATAPAPIQAEIEALANGIAKLAEDEGALGRSRDALAAIRAAGVRQDYDLARLRMGVRRLGALWPPAAKQDYGDSPGGKARLRIERMIETMGPAPASRPAGG